MNEFLDPEQTKRHDPLMTLCAEYIIRHQGYVIPTEMLVTRFLGDFTKGKETKVRQVIEEYVKDTIFQKIIISVHDGYIHPVPGKQDFLIRQYIKTTKKTGKATFFRLGKNLERLRNDGQYKEILGKYDSPIYETFLREDPDAEEEEEAETFEKPPVFDPKDEIDDYLVVPKGAGSQVGMRF